MYFKALFVCWENLWEVTKFGKHKIFSYFGTAPDWASVSFLPNENNIKQKKKKVFFFLSIYFFSSATKHSKEGVKTRIKKQRWTYLTTKTSSKASIVSNGPLYELCTSVSPESSPSNDPPEASLFLPIDDELHESNPSSLSSTPDWNLRSPAKTPASGESKIEIHDIPWTNPDRSIPLPPPLSNAIDIVQNTQIINFFFLKKKAQIQHEINSSIDAVELIGDSKKKKPARGWHLWSYGEFVERESKSFRERKRIKRDEEGPYPHLGISTLL